jgi:hypothetical protein
LYWGYNHAGAGSDVALAQPLNFDRAGQKLTKLYEGDLWIDAEHSSGR